MAAIFASRAACSANTCQPDTDMSLGAVRSSRVPPAAVVVLRVEDELHGLLRGLAVAVVRRAAERGGHLAGVGQREGGDAMLVHVAKAKIVLGVEERPVRPLMGQQPIERLANATRVFGRVEVVVSAGLKGEHGQPGLGHAVFAARLGTNIARLAAALGTCAERVGTPMSVGRLVPGEPIQAAADGRFRFGRAAIGPDPLLPLRILPHRGKRLVQRIEEKAVVAGTAGIESLLAGRAAVQTNTMPSASKSSKAMPASVTYWTRRRRWSSAARLTGGGGGGSGLECGSDMASTLEMVR